MRAGARAPDAGIFLVRKTTLRYGGDVSYGLVFFTGEFVRKFDGTLFKPLLGGGELQGWIRKHL